MRRTLAGSLLVLGVSLAVAQDARADGGREGGAAHEHASDSTVWQSARHVQHEAGTSARTSAAMALEARNAPPGERSTRGEREADRVSRREGLATQAHLGTSWMGSAAAALEPRDGRGQPSARVRPPGRGALVDHGEPDMPQRLAPRGSGDGASRVRPPGRGALVDRGEPGMPQRLAPSASAHGASRVRPPGRGALVDQGRAGTGWVGSAAAALEARGPADLAPAHDPPAQTPRAQGAAASLLHRGGAAAALRAQPGRIGVRATAMPSRGAWSRR